MYHSRWKGNHYLAGLNYGKKLYQRGVNPFDKMKISQERKEYAQSCLYVYQKYYPEILDEIQGIADGLQTSVHLIQSFLFSMYAYTFCGCSCIAYTSQDDIFLGRNSDFLREIGKVSDSVYYHLENCYSFIGHTTAWCEIEDGINDQGLAVGLTFIYPTCIDIGFNAGMLVRYILEKCCSTKEAIDFLMSIPIGSAQTITIADRSGDICVVECNCQNSVVRRSKSNMIYTTNHFISEEMKCYQINSEDDIYSHERYKTMESIDGNKLDKQKLKNLLSGQYGLMCQYQNNIDTIWSVIYDLKNMSIERAEGNPSRQSFQKDKRFYKKDCSHKNYI